MDQNTNLFEDFGRYFSIDYGDISFWILQFIAISITAYLIPRLKITSFFGPILTAICLALINSIFWDAALFFKLPDSLTTQTILLLLINGVIFWIVVKVLPGIEVEGFLPALIAPVIFTATNLLIGYTIEKVDWGYVVKYCIEMVDETKEFVSNTSGTVKESVEGVQ
ncbi:MAG: phage holin family protein [Bdellovibrionota bacterium]|jgi:putative membrane protein